MPNIKRNSYADRSKKIGAAAEAGAAEGRAVQAKKAKKEESGGAFQNFISQADKQAESITSFKDGLKKSLEPKGLGEGDRTDLPSNATSAFFKKRGY